MIVNKLGALAFASRLRILSDKLSQDVGRIYKHQNLDFEPKWFLVFYQLTLKSPMSITEIAENIGKTHPAVNQIASEMLKAGIILASEDEKDKRKRLLSLSEKGNRLLIDLKPIWEDVNNANIQLIDSFTPNFLYYLNQIEKMLELKNMYERIKEINKQRILKSIEFIEYKNEYKDSFRLLNEEWLNYFFSIEPIDMEILKNPEEKIINQWGYIFFAKYKSEIIGTCALLKHKNNTYELTKMAVTEKYKGLSIGENLAICAIEKARLLDLETIFLITHDKLMAAVNLYKKLGFKKVSKSKNISYQRKGFEMVLNLKS